MTALILDSGALVALERDDRAVLAKLRVAQRNGLALHTTGIVVAETWRDEKGRQANLARLLKAIDVAPVDLRLGRHAGELLGKARAADAADATVVALAATGDSILTSDPHDIRRLVGASGRAVRVVTC